MNKEGRKNWAITYWLLRSNIDIDKKSIYSIRNIDRSPEFWLSFNIIIRPINSLVYKEFRAISANFIHKDCFKADLEKENIFASKNT
ncbi:MAG: hypothetical protein LBI14_00960 [Treponema sp.]|jgi:hypothetical protein|nr:hypothetical protein [Treponema sp.]